MKNEQKLYGQLHDNYMLKKTRITINDPRIEH